MSYEDVRSLDEQLDDLCGVLDRQIATIAIEADKLGINPVELRTPMGEWPLASLLAAKAQALHSIVLMKEHIHGGSVINIYRGTEDTIDGIEAPK